MRTIKRTFKIPEGISSEPKYRDKLATLVRDISEEGYDVRPRENLSKVTANSNYTIWTRFPGSEDFGNNGWDCVGRISGKRKTVVVTGYSRLEKFFEQYKFK